MFIQKKTKFSRGKEKFNYLLNNKIDFSYFTDALSMKNVNKQINKQK